MLLVILGVCVFLWGFGYKLSLYNLQQPTIHRVPEAKLLSKNEDTQTAEGIRQAQSLGQSQLPMLLVLFAAISIAIADTGVRSRYFNEKSWANEKVPSAIPIPSLYFRPPPIQSVL